MLYLIIGVDKMLLDAFGTLNEWSEKLKMWIFDHYTDPSLWLFLFIILLTIVMMGYNYLHRR